MKLPMVVALFAAAAALADTSVYRWVDASGVVHYSDQPQPGAVKVDLGAPQVIDFKAPQALSATAPVTIVRPASSQVYELRILAPADGTTLRPVNNEVPARVAVSPPLGIGARLQYLLDGQPLGPPTRATAMRLTQVYRGTHTLTVTVLAPDDEAAGTASSTFFVHQHSALFRPRPGPKPPPGSG
ncbi:MAG TPA: DUF4124 domain-containing protein, partial [Gammaproteobacteria bacterium]|nr:DUF4124 domain-containing protein [Gammaproteobacteria bacterium]